MQTNRRSFVRMLSYGALSYAVGGSLTDSLMAECPSSPFVCILLHGLFFMSFKGNNLIVATPQFGGHLFGMREQGAPIIGPVLGGPNINWTSGLIDNPNTKTFPSNIPQFSSGATGVGEFMPAGTTTHQFQLILPRPDQIHGFREDLLADFQQCTVPNRPKPAGLKPMRENIVSNCGNGSPTAHFALLTGLIFRKTNQWKRKNVVSLYAEHSNSCNMKNDDVNAALQEGKRLFAAHQNFDLIYKDPDNPLLSICPPECDFFGVTKNDQLNIEELTLTPPDCCQTRGPNPINCAQYGVNM